ncbi:uncharacterized protein LOC126455898 [Schistocerca serialis cubense]|uniref:uncharacterized protein LOC126455898 n=1 Tax=Schistocerca serialis cubense TaxID=2023355 RepID=UPI00214F3A39|nr:uncharacterized protein LOC126455898 [Schistocerca serialis cubense]
MPTRLLLPFRVLWALAGKTVFMLNDLHLFLEALEYFDGYVHKKWKSNKILGIILIIIFAVLLIGECVLATFFAQVHYDEEAILRLALYTVIRLLENLVTLQCILLVLEVRTRFQIINDSILTTAASNGNSHISRILLGVIHSPEEDCHPRVSQIDKAHAILHRAAELLQQHFGLTLALQITQAVQVLIYGSYEILTLWIDHTNGRRALISKSILYSAEWIATYLVGAIALVVSCSAMVDEAERTRVLVVRAATLGWRRGLQPEVEALLLQVMALPPLSVRAAGFLTIDRKLLVSALCATITYLVILGQISFPQQPSS